MRVGPVQNRQLVPGGPVQEIGRRQGGAQSRLDARADHEFLAFSAGVAQTRPHDRRQFRPTARHPRGLMVGMDVGSTTVKAVVVDPACGAILWRDYRRHGTRQPETVLEFLRRIEDDFPEVPRETMRVFITGSGGASLAGFIGARHVQEVNAVSLAVERLFPDVRSVIELGGQDAKIIVFKHDPQTGRLKKLPSMNDKCAGGTGAVIDKIVAKLQIPPERLPDLQYDGLRIHPVAGKCGVFAETDINGLQKQGVHSEELMASLFESIVLQNLSVLTRGHTLMPKVLLLGGPNTFIRGMVECWRHHLPQVWAERNVELPKGAGPEDLVVVPPDAQYFGAIGAVEFGKIETDENPNVGVYQGHEHLAWYIDVGRIQDKQACGVQGLWRSRGELDAFLKEYRKERWEPATFRPGQTVRAFIGVDGGSTSTKGILMDPERNVIAKAYQLSKGNPIEDTIEIIGRLREQVERQGATLEILGVGTTGYAKDILKEVIGADVALVETVAHTQACLHYYPGADVICDVGGQDIKLIFLKNGQVKDFKLNTQCSAGNGYFLQSTAMSFGYDVQQYAEAAFAAESMPEFGYGCAVFLQADIVDFQRKGWQANEIMAALAAVLPKNIWLYVAQMPNLAKLGRTFVLQGGTQHNLAAVKAQVDFIRARFQGSGIEPRILVHEHCGESGAIGCAMEAHRLWSQRNRRTTFIGLDNVRRIEYRVTRDERTRCSFCKNKCIRTFIDVTVGTEDDERAVDLSTRLLKSGAEEGHPTRFKKGSAGTAMPAARDTDGSRMPLRRGQKRLIVATCERGTVEDREDMLQIQKGLAAVKKANPNVMDFAAREAFLPGPAGRVHDPIPARRWYEPLLPAPVRHRLRAMRRREGVRIGIPRVLNLYSLAPFFRTFFESLGVPAENVVFSDYTSLELYKAGCKRGSIDPCWPSKVCIAHVHNLLYRKHTPDRPLHYIWFPMIDAMPSWLENVVDNRACPTAAITPESVKAAYIKEQDAFAHAGVKYLDPMLHMDEPALLVRQLRAAWGEPLGLSAAETRRAVQAAYQALEGFQRRLHDEGRRVLEQIEQTDRVGLVVLSRPYHADPGISHGIIEELQKLGYPVLTQDCLPIDERVLARLFGEEVAADLCESALSIDDVWKNSYSENTNRKIWAAKFVARHPNLVGLELSSFKCGHDAPIYTLIEDIIETSGTPYFCFKDIDENKPTGSIKIRIETIGYFLKRYSEELAERRRKARQVEEKVRQWEQQLAGQRRDLPGETAVAG
jgi:activator of 2-hydroxyglutaryl-CoA dehydratase/predicted nucleotide-binding protein (sugar kinase/HSP70/actin superfamily)